MYIHTSIGVPALERERGEEVNKEVHVPDLLSIHDACTLLSYLNVTFTYTCVGYRWDTWEMMQATSDRKHKYFLYCCCYSLWRAQVSMGI